MDAAIDDAVISADLALLMDMFPSMSSHELEVCPRSQEFW